LSPKALAILEQEKPGVVYYLAGPMELRKGAGEAELKAWQEKYAGLESVFSAVKKIGARLVLVSSGGAIYSSPDSPYAKGSLFLEAIAEKSGADHVIVRFSNIYGPGQWREGVVPSVILHVLHGLAVTIGGDGSQTRDFLYIDDAVFALVQVALGREQGIFDVGSGKEVSINDVVAMVETILNKKANKEYHGSAGPQKSVVDPQKFQAAFNWTQKVDIKEGLAKTIEWYKQNG
jgi:UDP-glucose 4-epimerase